MSGLEKSVKMREKPNTIMPSVLSDCAALSSPCEIFDCNNRIFDCSNTVTVRPEEQSLQMARSFWQRNQYLALSTDKITVVLEK